MRKTLLSILIVLSLAMLVSCSKSNTTETNTASAVTSVIDTIASSVTQIVEEIVKEPTFTKTQNLDEFGEPTGKWYVSIENLKGTYKTESVKDGKIVWSLMVDESANFSFRILENNADTNLSTARIKGEKYTITVKEENGNKLSYTTTLDQSESYKYNVITFKSSSFREILVSNNSIQIVISNDSGSYTLGTLDLSSFNDAYCDAETRIEIDNLIASGKHDDARIKLNEYKNSNLFGYNCWDTAARFRSMGDYVIGDVGPAGSYVFYDCDADNLSGNDDGLTSSECGWRYLEVAPEDCSSAAVFGFYRNDSKGANLYVNGTTVFDATNCTNQNIGSGKSNTEKHVNAMKDGAFLDDVGEETTNIYAAKLCFDYTFGGFDDWFLPSSEELKKMVDFLSSNKLLTGSSLNTFWSSTEGYLPDALMGYGKTVGNSESEILSYSKSFYRRYNGGAVRAIRSF